MFGFFRSKAITPILKWTFEATGCLCHSPGLDQPGWWRAHGVNWSSRDLTSLMMLRQLEDDGLARAQGNALLIPYEAWDELEGGAEQILQVAEPWPYEMVLESVGDPSGPMSLRLQLKEKARKVQVTDLGGPFFSYNQKNYRLTPEQAQVRRHLEKVEGSLRGDRLVDRLIALGRVLDKAQSARVPLDGFLANQHIVSPETVIPEVRAAGPDTIEVCPQFSEFTTDTKLQNQLDQDRQIQEIYQYNTPDGRSARVALSPPVRQALQELKPIRKLAGKARRRFLDHPEEFLKSEAFDLSLFSDRVIGLGVPQVRVYPQLPTSQTEWAPTITLRLEDESGERDPWDLVVDAQDVEVMLERLQEASKDQSSCFEFKGTDFPANPVLREKLEQLQKRLQQPEPEPLLEPRPERVELEIRENIDSVEYHTVGASEQEIGPLEMPATLLPSYSFKAHQAEGVAWLQSLYRNPDGKGALLADDMGLGKTLQVWSFLEWIRLGTKSAKPSLIVCPVSLVGNWELEYRKFFGGSLAVRSQEFALLQGAGTRDFVVGNRLDLDRLSRYSYVITSYETLRQFHLWFPQVDWGCVVLDEAQKIKNPAAQVTRAAKSLKADFRVAATGTPVENSLAELWCIVDFIEPGRLGCLRDFLKQFPDDPTQAENLTERIKEQCGPILKRRMKSQVADGLPPKTPISAKVVLSEKQQSQYRKALALPLQIQQDRTAALQLIFKLRALCAFHQGVELCGSYEDVVAESAKFGWLLNCLNAIRDKREKAIIFVELKEYQRLLAYWLGEIYKLDVRIINGEVSADRHKDGSRHKILEEFERRPGFQLLILSPIAAGVGLTITCANHVIHYMRHWNPAKEDQATDRAYRIGQEREVFVYYPVCTHPEFRTFDEGLHDLLERKRELAKQALFPSLVGEVKIAELLGQLEGKPGETLPAVASPIVDRVPSISPVPTRMVAPANLPPLPEPTEDWHHGIPPKFLQALLHLEKFGSLHEEQLVRFVGGASAARRFDNQLASLQSQLPFHVRVNCLESGKVYKVVD